MFANNFGKYHNVECGLVHQCLNRRRGKRSFSDIPFTQHAPLFVPVPLISVSVTASVVHCVAQVEITQVYSNKETEPIEAIYFFPVDSNGAVTHFQAELDGKIINGVVKSNDEAKAQYEKAVERKQTAFLGEENKPDIFKVSIGYLKPGSKVTVVIGYVTEVKNEPDTHAIRFFIPTTVAPRYVPGSGSDEKSLELVDMDFSRNSPAPMTIKVIASFQGEIKSIDSPSHKITVESKGAITEKSGWNKSIVTLDGNTTEMDRDFVVLITPTEPLKPRLYSETLEDGSTALMTHFIPSFKLDDNRVELIIVLDRSGSMQGSNIRMAQKALLLFLHSMPADCFFNVVGFGSSYHFLFGLGSTKYNDESLLYATRYAEGLQADLGGTEILEPLREIYVKPLIPGYLRQIFLITDGQVSNTDSVVGLIKKNAHKSRVFALGIGNSVSHHLIEGVSAAGGGTCAFVEGDENIQKQTLGQLKNALQPSLTDVKVEWKGVEQNVAPLINKEKTLFGYNKPIDPESDVSPTFVQSPRNIPPVHDGSQMVIFGVFPKDKPTGAKITADSPDGPLTLDLELSDENDVGSTKMVHRLAAIKIVRELEMEDIASGSAFIPKFNFGTPQLSSKTTKMEIIEIAVKNGIASKYTSFVAVDEHSTSLEDNYWAMQTRYVPSQIPQGWHGGGGGGFSNFGSAIPSVFQQPLQQQQMMKCRQPRTFRSTTSSDFSDSSGIGTFGGQTGSFAFGAAPTTSLFGSSSDVLFGAQNQPFNFSQSSNQPTNFNFPTATSQQGSSAFSFSSTTSTQPQQQLQSGSSGNFSFGMSASASPQQFVFGQPVKTEIPMETHVDDIAMKDLDEGPRKMNLNLVHTLITLQSFQGSFPLNAALANIFAVDINLLKAESLKHGWDETAWATALAVVFLSDKLAEWKDYWELVVIKAQKWMDQNYLQVKDSMISTARFVVNSENFKLI